MMGCGQLFIGCDLPAERSAAERMAINTVCQSSAADIIKVAMIQIHKKFKAEFSDRGNLISCPRLVLQVHDELIYEVNEKDISIVQQIVKSEMEKSANLLVPLKVKMQTGNCWSDFK